MKVGDIVYHKSSDEETTVQITNMYDDPGFGVMFDGIVIQSNEWEEDTISNGFLGDRFKVIHSSPDKINISDILSALDKLEFKLKQ